MHGYVVAGVPSWWGWVGLGQMTQDTYGNPYLHTFLAFLNI